ncbi:DUF4397 domain-containing protein [Nostoc sp. FACHB-87]|uniref:DUF4397 domain-containing protein n=1 Tax=Nostocales TaxID=1161 RepID=UPI001685AB81|nr:MULTISPECIES: DUF4397 domain-containing protein [Nostocales]MBD2456767.1 DUF4397 domain-containing protein [Nostoc sp. FACHB-87]MBD2476464.1 DUF4397 domain-containing protein [Anabaena sp. FACHB-83]MBD2488407.1 DUF4397 domain-containing protein [Aulosira sp. FACHB-615]
MFLTRRLFSGALALSLMSWTIYPYKSLAYSQLSTESSKQSSTQSISLLDSLLNPYKCPTKLRVINAAVGTASPVDVIVNGKKVLEDVDFRQASKYVNVTPGNLHVLFVRSDNFSTIASRTFTGAPNSAYTVAITGTLPGPSGQPLFNQSPFVIPEDLTQPNPGKFKGRWYRFSETSAVIDFRISKSSSPTVDETRITDLIPKTAIAYPELTAGTYNFNPVLPDQFAPLINNAFNPPIAVEVANQAVPAGVIFDVIATGNALGQTPNSLTLTTASTQVAPPDANGCTQIVP